MTVSANTLCIERQEVIRSSRPISSIITCFAVLASGALLLTIGRFFLDVFGPLADTGFSDPAAAHL